ncbi:MAG: N-acetylmuramoyl-L-alanine amidase [Candidatus Kapabacteria bacterium]|nr:N-acetylmuramoyl-L-alanine amidase [Candidatus Kapabacteria bacterium]
MLTTFVIFNNILLCQKNQEFLTTKIKPGDGITLLLQRFNLEISSFNINKFKELNQKKISSKEELFLHHIYKLPILTLDYDPINFESMIESISNVSPQKVLDFNNNLIEKGLIKKDYKSGKKIYIPLSFLKNQTVKIDDEKTEEFNTGEELIYDLKEKKGEFKIFGEKYSRLTKKSSTFKGFIFYLVSGHGGPDPGAIGFKDGYELHEDEYAYDVTLRLGRNLIENGAKVFFLVYDKNDGIRDEKFLTTSSKEIFSTGDTISIYQKERLAKGSDIINALYEKYKKNAKEQISINIHLDSRETKQKIDIFFYHQDNDKKGENIANILLTTIKDKYDKNQPGRGYKGTVSTRNLFMLKNTIPTTLYIELGNIQNERDQIRFIEYNNRQAIANWLFEGLKKSFFQKK